MRLLTQLTALGLGRSTAVDMAADPVKGVDFVDVLAPRSSATHKPKRC